MTGRCHAIDGGALNVNPPIAGFWCQRKIASKVRAGFHDDRIPRFRSIEGSLQVSAALYVSSGPVRMMIRSVERKPAEVRGLWPLPEAAECSHKYEIRETMSLCHGEWRG